MVPDFDFTRLMSPALIEPLAFTSVRKLEPLTAWPDCPLAWATSLALTLPLLFVSPMSTPICTPTSPVVVPLFTPSNVTVILWALVTPVRLTVTVVVPLPPLPLTDPAPPVTAALMKVTELAKVKITW